MPTPIPPTPEQVERLFWALRKRNLPDLCTHGVIQEYLEKVGNAGASRDPKLIYQDVRKLLAPDFDDDAVWIEAHRTLQALTSVASEACGLSTTPTVQSAILTGRFPGYSQSVLERLLADARFALR